MRWRAAVWRLCAGVRSARVRTPETQVQTAPGVGLRGWRGRSNCQLTSPPSGQSQLKAVTHGGKVNSKAVTPGPKSTGVRFRRRLTNRTNESNPQLSKACQPCTSAAHSHAPSRAQPCSRRLCRRAPPRTHTISRSAAVSHAPRLVLASWRRLTPLARRLLHICLGAKTAPHPGRLCSQAEGRPQLLFFLATLCTTTRPRLSPRLLAPPSR